MKLKESIGKAMIFAFVFVVFFSSLVVLRTPASAHEETILFSDNFDDGVIDSSKWLVSGDGITEDNGVLCIFRNAVDDAIRTIDSFSGSFQVELAIRLDQISWQDMFHGISLWDSEENGISFGFCQYGKFYQAIHSGDFTSFYYGSSFQLNKWYHWKLLKEEEEIYIYVDGKQEFASSISHVKGDIFISLPGLYEDGNGGAGTKSCTDYLTVTVTLPSPVGRWNASITATFSSGADDAIFGVMPDATSGFDYAYDIPEPPPPVEPPYLQTFFYYSGMTPDELHRSCLAPENLMEWPLRIEYADNIENVTLTWSVENVPTEYNVLLYREGDLVANMRVDDNYTFEASTGSYDFRIVVGRFLPFTLELAQGWNMISFPVLPENPSPDAIFDSYYVLYGWDAEDKRYVIHADSGSFVEPDPNVEVGVGYWVYVLEDENVDLLGVPVNQLSLGLRQGWNLIGPPYGGSSIADPADDPDNSVLPWAFTWDSGEKGYSMTQLLEAGKGYWEYALRDCTLTLLLTRGEELIVNGDFSTGDATGWGFGFATEPSYGSEPTYEIVNYTARIYRTGAGSTGRGGWLYQNLNVNVSDASELILSCNVKVDYQSLSGTGGNSTEPPAFVEILYTGTDGQDTYRWWGFYYTGTSSNPWDEKVPQSTWFYRSYDLTTLSPKPVVIKRVYIGGSGWDYDASFDDVSLLYAAV